MLCVMCRSSLLDQGLLVNIQQPVIQSDGTLLLAADSKVPKDPTASLNFNNLYKTLCFESSLKPGLLGNNLIVSYVF